MQSLASTVRAAESVLAQHRLSLQSPRVLWPHLEEAAEAFGRRCAGLQLDGISRILAPVPFGFPVPDGVQAVPLAPKLWWLLHPGAPSRYRCASGGRESAKSHSFATAIVLAMLSRKVRVLCARELMHSLRESVHHLLVAKIEALGLSRYFEVLDREISCPLTRSEAIFAGLHTNVRQLASLEAVGLCWIEEAESISKESLEVLTPTIRLPGSEIWFSLNPDEPAAPVQAFADGARPDTRRIHVVFTDNPFLTPTLDAERSYLQRVDPDAYAHVWLGQTRSHSEAAVFAGKYQVEEFTPVPEPPEGASIHPKRVGSLKFWQGPYFGADWGFSQDPTTLVKCWIYERTLYIEHEAWAIGCDLDKTPALFDTVPGARLHTVRADNARPETISYLRRNGFPRLAAVEKWKNSATDGVAYLRSYERIVIHPRCTHTIEEFRLYSYRVDRLTGDVQPELLDLHNHCIDALRYALAPAIRNRGRGRIVPLRV